MQEWLRLRLVFNMQALIAFIPFFCPVISVKRMNIKMRALMASLVMGLFLGCAGIDGQIIKQSESDSRAAQKMLIANRSDYHIWHRSKARVIGFDPKMMIGLYWWVVNSAGGGMRLKEWKHGRRLQQKISLLKANSAHCGLPIPWTM